MPKFSVILPTRDTSGDFEEMCWPAGGQSAVRIHAILPAAVILKVMALEARISLAHRIGHR